MRDLSNWLIYIAFCFLNLVKPIYLVARRVAPGNPVLGSDSFRLTLRRLDFLVDEAFAYPPKELFGILEINLSR